MTLEKRVEKLENNQDKITEVVVTLAGVTEKITRLFERQDKSDARQERLEDKVDKLGGSVQANSFVTRSVERFGWIVLTAAVGTGFFFLR